jgi:hypothetical protein
MITAALNDILLLMQKPKEFSIVFVLANRQTKEAGRIVALHQAILSKFQNGGKHQGKSYANTKAKKNPQHWRNATRNLFDKQTQRFYKVHIYLIIQFNGLPVRYGA